KPSGSVPTSPPTAACASSSPNSKPSLSSSPNSTQHPKHRETSPLKPGPALANIPVTADQQGSVVGPLINSLTCADVQAVEDVTVLAGPVFKISTSKGHDQHKVSGSEVESRRPG